MTSLFVAFAKRREEGGLASRKMRRNHPETEKRKGKEPRYGKPPFCCSKAGMCVAGVIAVLLSGRREDSSGKVEWTRTS